MKLQLPNLNGNSNGQDGESSMGKLNLISIFILLFGIGFVLLFGAGLSGKATIFLWMLACLLSGTAIGFLFGIPKILQSNSIPPTGVTNPGPVYQQQVNTNLTEISDWLTKIIVGLSLVNLAKLPPYLHNLSTVLAGGLSLPGKAPNALALAFAYGTIISYFILGFLFGYIMTRLYLAGAFSEADQKALRLATKKAEEAVGAANSALQKAEFALVKPSEMVQNNNTPEQKLTALAQSYVITRSQMPSGAARTSKMGQIFKSMIEVAASAKDFDISAALKEQDSGKRLSGYASLYANPEPQFLKELVDAITTDPTPFGQYWGIQTLKKILEVQPGQKMDPGVYNKLKTYYDGLRKGVDREYELRKLLPGLAG